MPVFTPIIPVSIPTKNANRNAFNSLLLSSVSFHSNKRNIKKRLRAVNPTKNCRLKNVMPIAPETCTNKAKKIDHFKGFLKIA